MHMTFSKISLFDSDVILYIILYYDATDVADTATTVRILRKMPITTRTPDLRSLKIAQHIEHKNFLYVLLIAGFFIYGMVLYVSATSLVSVVEFVIRWIS